MLLRQKVGMGVLFYRGTFLDGTQSSYTRGASRGGSQGHSAVGIAPNNLEERLRRNCGWRCQRTRCVRRAGKCESARIEKASPAPYEANGWFSFRETGPNAGRHSPAGPSAAGRKVDVSKSCRKTPIIQPAAGAPAGVRRHGNTRGSSGCRWRAGRRMLTSTAPSGAPETN